MLPLCVKCKTNRVADVIYDICDACAYPPKRRGPPTPRGERPDDTREEHRGDR